MDLKQHIRHVPDFPKPGILFYDITTLLRDPEGFKTTIDRLSAPYMGKGIDVVVGIESRGFILGAAVAERIGAGFIPIRKPGKLPGEGDQGDLRPRVRQGRARDSRRRGGEGAARADRGRRAGDRRHGRGRGGAGQESSAGQLHGLAFLIELLFLNGKAKLAGEQVYSVLQY